MAELTVLLEKYSFLEAPRWRAGRLWLSDFYTHQVISTDGQGSDLQVEAEVPGRPAGLGWLPDGRLLIVSMSDHRLLRREHDGRLVEHADLSAHCGGAMNDLAVDAQGRAYVGNFGFDVMNGADVAPTPLVLVHPDGRTEVASEPLYFPNGALVLDSTLVVAETFGNRISAFPQLADGRLGERRDWAVFGAVPADPDLGKALSALAVGPDGITVDASGALWVADALNNRVLRVREGGEILDEISTGETGTYAPVLGGADGRNLYLCTAPGFLESERRDTRESALLMTRVEVPAASL